MMFCTRLAISYDIHVALYAQSYVYDDRNTMMDNISTLEHIIIQKGSVVCL